jgi:hypothetical protein
MSGQPNLRFRDFLRTEPRSVYRGIDYEAEIKKMRAIDYQGIDYAVEIARIEARRAEEMKAARTERETLKQESPTVALASEVERKEATPVHLAMIDQDLLNDHENPKRLWVDEEGYNHEVTEEAVGPELPEQDDFETPEAFLMRNHSASVLKS